jgi:hypothetical protein
MEMPISFMNMSIQCMPIATSFQIGHALGIHALLRAFGKPNLNIEFIYEFTLVRNLINVTNAERLSGNLAH